MTRMSLARAEHRVALPNDMSVRSLSAPVRDTQALA